MSPTSENHKVSFGILLPTREVVMSGGWQPSRLFEFAERAEALGFHSVWVGDSITAKPRLEALTTLAAVGARTKTVRLGTAVLLAALRHPILLAHTVANIDWLSGGRVDLGIGYSRPSDPVQEHEFEVLGLSVKRRIKMSEEIVRVMRRLWRENDVAHAGEFANFDHVSLEPKPVQPGGVPIWLASNNVEPGLRRVGRLGDGWLTNVTSARLYKECLNKIRDYAAQAGREAGDIQAGLYFTLAGGEETARREAQEFLAQYYNKPYESVARAMLCVTGAWDEVIDHTEAYIESGARTVVMRFASRDQFGQLEACADALKRRRLLGGE
ncbi:MAG: LLM class flavin-dependent oxidoreductase [Deltaproteobacteria bacterium]|nr:LLM class flavin-dependent oxidoreductase [Deltaproteobacteria bacterium]